MWDSTEKRKEKLSMFCNVPVERVISAPDVDSIYEVPLHLHGEGLDEKIVKKLGIWTRSPQLKKWKDLIHKIKNHFVKFAVAKSIRAYKYFNFPFTSFMEL